MRIFLGCEEIAANLKGLASGFRTLGHEVTAFAFNLNAFYQEQLYDILFTSPLQKTLAYQQKKFPRLLKSGLYRADNWLSTRKLKKITPELIASHDVFIFIWRPWLPEEYLFPLIRAAGKPIICLHMGSDVRHIAAYKQQYNEDVSLWESFFHTEDLNEKIWTVRMHEKYASLIYSVPDQAGLYIRPYNHIYMVVAPSEQLRFEVPGRERPVLLHIPSRSGIKGTKYILEAVETLKTEGLAFDFKMLSGAPQKEVLAALSDADMLVDELLLHGPGALSAEAMACGCAVATHTLSTHKDIFNPPVANISPKNIMAELRRLINDKAYRMKLVEDGRKFFETYNNATAFARQIIDDIALLPNTRDQYMPDFYLQKFLLPNGFRMNQANLRLGAEIAAKYFKGDKSVIENARRSGLIL